MASQRTEAAEMTPENQERFWRGLIALWLLGVWALVLYAVLQ
jgi:hypothetical protein